MSELLNLKNGIQILNTYAKQANGFQLHIYVGQCNGILTKWVTQSDWDFKLRIQVNADMTDVDYFDSNNKEVLVYEQDEAEWELY
jgi:hypothetical protein